MNKTQNTPPAYSEIFWDEWAELHGKLNDHLSAEEYREHGTPLYLPVYTSLWSAFCNKWNVTIDEIDDVIEGVVLNDANDAYLAEASRAHRHRMQSELEDLKKDAELWEARARRAWYFAEKHRAEDARYTKKLEAELEDVKKACDQYRNRLGVSRLLVKQLNRDIAQIRSDETSEPADKE